MKGFPIRTACLLMVILRMPLRAQPLEAAALTIIEQRCVSCHGAAQMAGLDLRHRETLLQGGKRGPAVKPGYPESSLLYRAVAGKAEFKMPPGKEALASREIEVLRQWIASGAQWPAETVGMPRASEPSWWSFRKPERRRPPTVRHAENVANPIDAFLLEKIEEKGLVLAPLADRRTLIRRAYFDLTGLPPTPEQIECFVQDNSANAYARVLDALLASPRYGERWGRH